MKASTEHASKKYKILKVIIISLPLWLPFVYLALSIIERKFTSHGPLNELAIYALWGTPAVGALPILMESSIPLLIRLIITPVYYCIGLIMAGIIGWTVGCSWEVVGCH